MANENENPLLEAIGDYIDLDDWPRLLERNPLEDFPANPTAADRNKFIMKARERFATTRTAIRVAYDIQSMIRASYVERDPTLPHNRRIMFEMAKLEGELNDETPVFYSESLSKLMTGILGTGKSAVLDRVLSAYPKLVVHGPSKSAYRLRHMQVPYLKAKMSGDGSRNGLLLSILAVLDKAVGSDYFHEIGRRRMSVEERMLEVARLLAQHSVGLLVIEEMQAENLIETKHKTSLRTFFLGILSFGVPLVLVGNPRAFTSIREFKQTESRFLSVEPTEFWPFHDYKDADWMNALAPAIWNYQVVDRAEPFSPRIAEVLWKCSGGVPRYARRLVEEVQHSVLLGAAPALTEKTLTEHFDSLVSFRHFKPLIKGLTSFSPDGLVDSDGKDIPADLFRQHWERLGLLNPRNDAGEPESTPPEKDPAAAPEKPETGDWKEEKTRQKARRKATKTRKKKKQAKNKALQNEVSEDDLRYQESYKNHLVRSLNELRQEIEEQYEVK